MVAGCGVKSPPLPPKRQPPGAVTDLSGAVDGELLSLTWGIPPESDQAGEAVGFAVYRSRTPLGEVACRDCPLVFEQAGEVSVTPSDRQAGRMTFSENLEQGYRYRYKLRSFDAFGAVSDDSNTVILDYEGMDLPKE
jgi:hypothetical protein